MHLCRELDQDDKLWRSTHILVLDNCSSHKTKLVREVLKKSGFTTLFTAPASYIACPVEQVFSLIKKIKLDTVSTPLVPDAQSRNITRLTNKQRVQLKIAQYLRGVGKETIQRVFLRSLRNL